MNNSTGELYLRTSEKQLRLYESVIRIEARISKSKK